MLKGKRLEMLQAIVGRRGTGKTSLAWWTARRSRAARILILDYKGDFGGLASERVYVRRFIVDRDVFEFCELAWELADRRSRTLVLFDEVACYGKDNPFISYLYRMGRDWNIDILAVAHRFYDLPKYVRTLSDRFSVFQIIEPTDLNYLARYLPDFQVKTILNLSPFTFVNLSF
jgi:predicted AAA+ superfamily ATPase